MCVFFLHFYIENARSLQWDWINCMKQTFQTYKYTYVMVAITPNGLLHSSQWKILRCIFKASGRFIIPTIHPSIYLSVHTFSSSSVFFFYEMQTIVFLNFPYFIEIYEPIRKLYRINFLVIEICMIFLEDIFFKYR